MVINYDIKASKKTYSQSHARNKITLKNTKSIYYF